MEPINKRPIVGHKPLQRLKIKMFGKVYTMNPAEDLRVKPSELGDQIQTQPAMYAFYATVRDMTQAKLDSLVAALSQKEADLAAEFYARGTVPSGAKATEDGVKKAVRADEEYQAIQAQIVDAQFEVNQMWSIVRAFEQRKDMIIEAAKRVNSATWNDRDVDVEVSAVIQRIPDEVRAVGAHPSKTVQ